jgi:hypothetical protein
MWLVQNPVIQNFAIFRILVSTYVPRKKNSYKLPGYLKNLDKS